MDLIYSKYIGLVSSRLQKFKRVKSDLYTFRCPICGDSQKNKNKTRGYIYPVKNNTNFKCHNCGASLSFNNFLKHIDPTLHKQYTLKSLRGVILVKTLWLKNQYLSLRDLSLRKDWTYLRHQRFQLLNVILRKDF